ncbi:MAG: single-stranded DNA-binding protein [Epsilonproteobacteria bacterium]|nr:single-stranded DNA-binding protein [Campylobacterota bacterium]
MFNKVVLVGNLTRDIELRYLPSGTAIGTTGIATNRKFRNQMGEQREEVCFIDITFFGRTAEIANQYLRKGSKVLVEGRLKYDQWTDQTGQKRSKHSVTVETLQMLDSRAQGAEMGGEDFGSYQQPPQRGYQQPQNQPPQESHNEPKIPEIDIDDNEIPF